MNSKHTFKSQNPIENRTKINFLLKRLLETWFCWISSLNVSKAKQAESCRLSPAAFLLRLSWCRREQSLTLPHDVFCSDRRIVYQTWYISRKASRLKRHKCVSMATICSIEKMCKGSERRGDAEAQLCVILLFFLIIFSPGGSSLNITLEQQKPDCLQHLWRTLKVVSLIFNTVDCSVRSDYCLLQLPFLQRCSHIYA